MKSRTFPMTPAQPDAWPDRVTGVRLTRQSGKYLRPLCVGLMTGGDRRRRFLRDLFFAHDYRAPARQPLADGNELFDVVVALGDVSIDECKRLKEALNVPVLVALAVGSTHGSDCTQLQFPCRFDFLEWQIACALGNEPPVRTDTDAELGVSVQRLLKALPAREGSLFRVLHEYHGACVPNDVLLERGFGATVSNDSRDRRVRALLRRLRWIAVTAERHAGGWCLEWTPPSASLPSVIRTR